MTAHSQHLFTFELEDKQWSLLLCEDLSVDYGKKTISATFIENDECVVLETLALPMSAVSYGSMLPLRQAVLRTYDAVEKSKLIQAVKFSPLFLFSIEAPYSWNKRDKCVRYNTMMAFTNAFRLKND